MVFYTPFTICFKVIGYKGAEGGASGIAMMKECRFAHFSDRVEM